MSSQTTFLAIGLVVVGLILAVRLLKKRPAVRTAENTEDHELKTLENIWAGINAYSKNKGVKELGDAMIKCGNDRKKALQYAIDERERENTRFR